MSSEIDENITKQNEYYNDFLHSSTPEDAKARKIFIGKVYGLLFMFLAATILQILPIFFIPEVPHFFLNHLYIFYISVVIYVTTLLIFTCFNTVRTTKPYNVLLVCLFIESLTVIVLYSTVYYGVYIVYMAFVITTGILLTLSMMASLCPFDLTRRRFLVSLAFIFFVACIFSVSIVGFFYQNRIIDIVYASIGVVVICVYFYFHTQAILGGYYIQVDKDDYVNAAIILYADFIGIFLLVATLLKK